MLAQNFMKASELGLVDFEFEALVTVLGMLERGEIRDGEFCMSVVLHPCGSPACICGWANHVSHGRAFPLKPTPISSGVVSEPEWKALPIELRALFSYGDVDAFSATADEAAQALRNYLQTGTPDWDAVLGERF